MQESSETVWRYYRYSLIYEFFDRPTLAPPLIVLNHVKRLYTHTRRKCRRDEKISHDFSRQSALLAQFATRHHGVGMITS